MIVYKYGGTSLLDEEEIVKTVNDGLKEHGKIIIVVSAIGRYPYPYSTDALFKLLIISPQETILLTSFCVKLSHSLKRASVE